MTGIVVPINKEKFRTIPFVSAEEEYDNIIRVPTPLTVEPLEEKKEVEVAFLFPGGGAHGAWQIAACKRYLLDNPDLPDPGIVAGVSVGALNGAIIAQSKDLIQGCDHALEVWNSINGWWNIYRPDFKTLTALFSFLSGFKALKPIFSEGLFSTKPLKKLIDSNVDPQKIINEGRKFICGAVNMSTGRYVRFDEQSDMLKEAILASASYPWLFRPVNINGEPYFDGGLRNKTPFKGASMYKPKKMVIFMAGALNTLHYVHPKSFTGMYASLERIFSILFDEAWRDDLQSCIRNYKNIDIDIVCRKDAVGTSSVVFAKKDIQKLIKEVLEPSDKSRDLYQVINGKEALHLLKPTEEEYKQIKT